MPSLVGTWELESWDSTLDGVPHGHPFGPDATGLLIYSADGTMAAMLMRAHRAPFEHSNLVSAPEREKARAVDGFLSYAGRWELDGTRVLHRVTFSLLPNWVGTTLVRECSWIPGDPEPKLLLTTIPERARSGQLFVNRLLWHRATPGSPTP